MRTIALALVLAAAGVLGACSDEVVSTADGGPDAGAVDAGGLFAGPTIGPDVYDCRVARAPLPAAAVAGRAAELRLRPHLYEPPRGGSPQRRWGRARAGRAGPENTLSALRAAIVLGVDFVETDPRLTRDGELVNVHDPDISLTTTDGQCRRADLGPDPGTAPALSRHAARRLLVRAHAPHPRAAGRRPRAASSSCWTPTRSRWRPWTPWWTWCSRPTLAEAVFDTSSLDKVARARARAPNIRVHIRPDTAADIAPEVAQVGQPPPVILELDLGDLDQAIPEARRVLPSAKLMSDVLGGLDLQMAIEGEPPGRAAGPLHARRPAAADSNR
jgi:glycerophosphoryl diester phosphodiesterase